MSMHKLTKVHAHRYPSQLIDARTQTVDAGANLAIQLLFTRPPGREAASSYRHLILILIY